MIQIKDVQIGYKDRVLLDIGTLSAERGKMIAVLGRNGQGKSSLLRTLAGLLKPKSGTIVLEDKSLDKLSHAKLSKMVSYFHSGRILRPEYMLVREFISLANAKADIDEFLTIFHIQHLKESSLRELSDGQFQMVGLLHVLSQDTGVVLLDELENFLDYHNLPLAFDYLRELLNKDKIILFSSHRLDTVKEYADEIWMVEDQTVKTFDDVHQFTWP